MPSSGGAAVVQAVQAAPGKTRSPRIGSSTLFAPSRPMPPFTNTVANRRAVARGCSGGPRGSARSPPGRARAAAPRSAACGSVETHPADQPGGAQKRARVEHEDRVAPEQHRHHAAERCARGQAERPRDRGQRVGGEHVGSRHDVGDHGAVGGLEERRADGLQAAAADRPARPSPACAPAACPSTMKKRADVGADHDALAADAVVEHAGGGRGEGAAAALAAPPRAPPPAPCCR